MKCECGFEFSGPGEFRNCAAFVTEDGQSGVVCPDCGVQYVINHGQEEKGIEDEKTNISN